MAELIKGLRQLGIRGKFVGVKRDDRICVFLNNVYFGLWDMRRKTFVD